MSSWNFTLFKYLDSPEKTNFEHLNIIEKNQLLESESKVDSSKVIQPKYPIFVYVTSLPEISNCNLCHSCASTAMTHYSNNAYGGKI